MVPNEEEFDGELLDDRELNGANSYEDEGSALDALADAADGIAHPPQAGFHANHPPRDDDGRIDTDLACIRCEYNLRGQLPEGSCPECGAPVAEAMRSDRLSQANPAWVRKLRRSMTWLMLGGASIILGSCLNGGINASTGPIGAGESIVTFAVSLIQAVFFGTGYWLLTEPEPAVIRPRVSRPLARWTIVPGYALTVPAGLLAMLARDPAPLIMAGVIQVAAGIAIMSGFGASLVYLRHLARRIPSQTLARQCTIVFWGSAGCIAGLIAGVLLVILFASTNPTQGFEMILLVFCPLGIAFLTFFIWWMVLISAFSRSFDRAVKATRNRSRGVRQYA